MALQPFDDYGGIEAHDVQRSRLDLGKNLKRAAELPTDPGPKTPLPYFLRLLVEQQANLARGVFLADKDITESFRQKMNDLLDGIGEATPTADRPSLLKYFALAQRIAATGAIFIQEPKVRAQLLDAESWFSYAGLSDRWVKFEARLDDARKYATTGDTPPGEKPEGAVQALLRDVFEAIPTGIAKERRKGGDGAVILDDAQKTIKKGVQATSDAVTAVTWLAGAVGVALIANEWRKTNQRR